MVGNKFLEICEGAKIPGAFPGGVNISGGVVVIGVVRGWRVRTETGGVMGGGNEGDLVVSVMSDLFNVLNGFVSCV